MNKVDIIRKHIGNDDFYDMNGTSMLTNILNAMEEYKEQAVKNCSIPDVVEPKGKLEMFQNMQYYMEHCQRDGYITPQDWLEKEKHF